MFVFPVYSFLVLPPWEPNMWLVLLAFPWWIARAAQVCLQRCIGSYWECWSSVCSETYKLLFKNTFYKFKAHRGLMQGVSWGQWTLVCIGRAFLFAFWVVLVNSCQLYSRPQKVKLYLECLQRFSHKSIFPVNSWIFLALELCINLSHQKDGITV